MAIDASPLTVISIQCGYHPERRFHSPDGKGLGMGVKDFAECEEISTMLCASGQ